MPNTPVFHKGTQQPLWFVHTKRHHKRHKSSEVGTMFKVKMAKLKPENGLNRTLVPVYKCIVHVQLLFYYTKAQEACQSHAPRGVKNTHFLFVGEIKVGASPNMCSREEKAANYIIENAAHEELLYNWNFKNYLQSHFEAAAKQTSKCLSHRLLRMIVISIWRRQYLE